MTERRVLINCEVREVGQRCLREAGLDVLNVLEVDVEATDREAPSCVGIIANASYPFDAAFFERCPQLRVLGRMGVGYDNVDIEAATRHGVRVCNTPLPIVEPVAEHTFALLLALARRVLPGDRNTRAGAFRQPEDQPGPEIAGKTLGVVGMGRTGARVAQVGHLAFGMPVLYADQVARPDIDSALGARRVPLDELLRESDVVSLHVNLSPTTRHLIGREALAAMKPSAWLLNVARGPVVDEVALVEALRSGEIAGAGLDVYEVEPPRPDNPLFALENVVLTPHRGGFSDESLDGCSRVAEDIVRVLRGETPSFPVN